MKTFITIFIVAIIALFALGIVYPDEAPVFTYSAMLKSFYAVVFSGLAGVALMDLKNTWDHFN